MPRVSQSSKDKAMQNMLTARKVENIGLLYIALFICTRDAPVPECRALLASKYIFCSTRVYFCGMAKDSLTDLNGNGSLECQEM